MRVVCENCGASYNIPESKLTKEVNKATCRKCGFRMMIRRPSEAPPQAGEKTDPTEAATQVTINPLQRQDAEREVLDAATRIEKGPVAEWAEDSPTNVQVDLATPPPGPAALGGAAPVIVPTGRAPGDMIIALVGTFASAAGAMLLATNTSGIASQRMIGLGIALWGALTCLFLLVTGNLWRQKGNVPISIALATVLGIGGTAFVELALHGNATSVDVPETTADAPKIPEIEPSPEVAAEALAENAKDSGEVQEAVAEAPAEAAPPSVVVPPPAAAPPPPPVAADPEALDEPDLDEFIPPPPVRDNADERRRQEMEEAAQARADARRQRDEAAAAREAQAAAAAARQAAAPPEPTGPPKMKSLPLTVVDTMIRSNLSVKRCFFNEQQRAGEMPTRVNVQFTVIQTGRVSSARVITDQYKGGPLDSCLGRAFKAIKFPAFEGESLSMNYPFVL
jgi:DNA-directed RNA polymerase subunit RPC12/RpoP